MIVVVKEDGRFHEDVSNIFKTKEEAIKAYGQFLGSFKIIECDDDPDVCCEWTWDGSVWHEPTMEGYIWMVDEKRFITHDEFRRILHSRTDPDVLEAQRKIREGDTSYDWQGWLNKLDAYNKAVSDTKNQPTYPDKVEYPEYPSR